MLALGALSLWRSANVQQQNVQQQNVQQQDVQPKPDAGTVVETAGARLFGYSGGLLIAIIVSLIYVSGARIRVYSETHTLAFHSADVELAFWSLVSHCALAIAVLSALNLDLL